MAKIGVQVEGLSRVVRALQQAGVQVEDMRAAMSDIARSVMPIYQQQTPVRSGRLRGDYRPSNAKGVARLYVGRASIPYAGPINYGWPKRNIRARNFIARGDAQAAPVAHDKLEDAISDLIRSLDLD